MTPSSVITGSAPPPKRRDLGLQGCASEAAGCRRTAAGPVERRENRLEAVVVSHRRPGRLSSSHWALARQRRERVRRRRHHVVAVVAATVVNFVSGPRRGRSDPTDRPR